MNLSTQQRIEKVYDLKKSDIGLKRLCKALLRDKPESLSLEYLMSNLSMTRIRAYCHIFLLMEAKIATVVAKVDDLQDDKIEFLINRDRTSEVTRKLAQYVFEKREMNISKAAFALGISYPKIVELLEIMQLHGCLKLNVKFDWQ
jgi:hypothetical protein